MNPISLISLSLSISSIQIQNPVLNYTCVNVKIFFPHLRIVFLKRLTKLALDECRIKEFNEWAQCIALELVSKYVPTDSDEIFDIMNLLEDRLQHANGAVVLATIKVFLHMTLSMTDVHQQVLKSFHLLFYG